MTTPAGRVHGRRDNGQATILMVVFIAAAMLLAVAIALIGQAMVHRARARTAADAIALAVVSDTTAADELMRYYAAQGATIERHNNGAHVGSGPSQADAWAIVTDGEIDTAPVLRAVVARVEQLRDVRFVTIRWHRTSFELADAEAQTMRAMAAEFTLCEQVSDVGYEFMQC